MGRLPRRWLGIEDDLRDQLHWRATIRSQVEELEAAVGHLTSALESMGEKETPEYLTATQRNELQRRVNTINRQTLEFLQAKSLETGVGEPGTGSTTTPTCGSIGGGLEPPDIELGSKEVMPNDPVQARHDNAAPSSVRVGEVCPTCGRKRPMTNAERVRRHRERKRQ